MIEECSIPAARLTRIGSLLAQLFKLENVSKPARIKAQVERIISELKAELPDDLRHDIALFISELLKPHNIHIPPHLLLAPTENRTMLADAFAQLKKDAADKGLKKGLKEGLKKGLKEGREEGREEGQRELLAKLLGLKFGPREERAAALAALSFEQIDAAVELLLSADSEQSIFDALVAAP